MLFLNIQFTANNKEIINLLYYTDYNNCLTNLVKVSVGQDIISCQWIEGRISQSGLNSNSFLPNIRTVHYTDLNRRSIGSFKKCCKVIDKISVVLEYTE